MNPLNVKDDVKSIYNPIKQVVQDSDFSTENLKALADFWPVFANPKFRWEIENTIEPKSKKEFTMPQRIWDKEATAFHKMVYEQEWVVDFDWTGWVETKEFKKMMDSQNGIETATPVQLAKLITALVRKERFCEGTLSEAATSGLLERITRRASQLI